MDPDPLASAETITLLRRFSAVVDTNRIFGHYGMFYLSESVVFRRNAHYAICELDLDPTFQPTSSRCGVGVSVICHSLLYASFGG